MRIGMLRRRQLRRKVTRAAFLTRIAGSDAARRAAAMRRRFSFWALHHAGRVLVFVPLAGGLRDRMTIRQGVLMAQHVFASIRTERDAEEYLPILRNIAQEARMPRRVRSEAERLMWAGLTGGRI